MPIDALSPAWAPLGTFTSRDELGKRLSAHGIEVSKADLFAKAAQRLLDEGVAGSTRAAAFWVPGRVEVLGKHTDYAGGRSILGAVTRGFAVVATERDDACCRFFASFALAGIRASATVPLTPDAAEPPPSGWAAYPTVAARRLARNFSLLLGVDLALECDLPEASGMCARAHARAHTHTHTHTHTCTRTRTHTHMHTCTRTHTHTHTTYERKCRTGSRMHAPPAQKQAHACAGAAHAFRAASPAITRCP